MAKAEGRSRFWRKGRVYFRRFRITVLLLLLAFLGVIIYLNLHGLPDFAKRPLLEKLRARGVDLEFSRLRLRTHRGLVAENVRFGQASEPGGPRLSAGEVELNLNVRALLRLQLQVDSLDLRAGRLVWPILETNAPPRTLTVEDIDARLQLLPGDEWSLDDFRARFVGARFFLSGNVTNASAIRNWKFPLGRQPGQRVQWAERLRRLAVTLEKISFTTPPELRLMLDGDARDLQSFTARLTLNAPAAADTPWGQATNVVITARLFPGAGGELSHLEMNLLAAAARTRWADIARLKLELHLDTVAGQTNLVGGNLTAQAAHAHTPWADAADLNLEMHFDPVSGTTSLLDGNLTLQAAHAVTKWAAATNAQLTAHWIHSLTNAVPLSGQGELRVTTANTRWADGTDVRLAATFAPATNPPVADASWAWWTNLQPYQLDWECEIAGAKSEKLAAEKILCLGQWRAPALTIASLRAQLYDGKMAGQAGVDVATREAWFGLASDFDAKNIAPLLTEPARRWLDKYSWVESPRLRGSGAVKLPAWTNPAPDWRAEAQPTLRLEGEFAVTNGAYLGVPADWARSRFTYTNRTWHLPDLEAARGGGRLRLEHIADDNTHDYYFRIHSTMDVRALRPLLATNQQPGFDLVTFTQAPVVDAEVRGRWHDHERIGFQGRVALTNFAFREQTADSFVSEMRYTNRVLELFEPRMWRGTQMLSAAAINADFDAQRVFITNGFSTADPMVVARAIGPKTARHLEPFVFKQPPTVRVEGYAPMKDERDADLRFTVDGGPFEWLKFKVPRISGLAYWRGETLSLTAVRLDFYSGEATGRAGFNFSKAIPGTDFNFAMTVTNANLQSLLADLSPHTNRLAGQFGGQLVVTNGNSTDFHSWNGYGHARLRDGLIWEIPVFGILSKALDSVVTGLGSSTISEGSARFGIRNGVIYSDDLEMRAITVRLKYEGAVDFDGRVDARVRAEPLRGVWIFGPLVNTVLWPVTKILEYKVSGTLSNPKTEPLYLIPRILMVPFHPIQTLEDLFTSEPAKTNAPPVFKEP